MSTILELKKLTKYYGKSKGIENISLKLQSEEIFGFIGPNGAGKSTTIRAMMHLINPTQGSILINGKELDPNDLKTKEIIGYLPSEVHLYDDFTVKEMLDYHETFYHKNIHQRRIELVKKLQLDEKKKIEDLSFGNLKKLGIVLALMHEPKILILDEPTSGLDPMMQQTFYQLLQEEKQKGTTIFYSTHILSEVQKICDRVGIIKDGHLITIETIDDLLQKNLTYVTVTSSDIEEIKTKLQNVKIISLDTNTIKFSNTMPINTLISFLGKYNIEKLRIEEATLEDMFFHYYK